MIIVEEERMSEKKSKIGTAKENISGNKKEKLHRNAKSYIKKVMEKK